MFADKIHYELVDVQKVRIWLEGEDLDAEAQLLVQFRKIGESYFPLLNFINLSDGVDFDSLNEINAFVQSHKSKLESIQL